MNGPGQGNFPRAARDGSGGRGYEPSDVPPAKVGLALAGLLGGALLALVLVGAVVATLASWRSEPTAAPTQRIRLLPPGPRLEQNPRFDRLQLEAAQRARVADGPGTPLASAMDRMARQGWGEPPGPPPPVPQVARGHAGALR